MEWPKRDDLEKCFCYAVMGAGWAYWNTQTKELFEFDLKGNLLQNETREKCPSKTFESYGKVYVKQMSSFHIPLRDLLNIESVYAESESDILTNEIALTIRQKLFNVKQKK